MTSSENGRAALFEAASWSGWEFDIAEDIRNALRAGTGVVALDSVGFAASVGLDGSNDTADVAVECMRRVRAAGCVPAFSFIDRGTVRLSADAADLVGFLGAGPVRRVGTRDISEALVRARRAVLTAGATITIAAVLGVQVVSTGGLGGVHHGFANSLDVASDVYRLGQTRVLLVSSGIRPFMDVPATAELLKSLGVPLLGWRTDQLPRVYTAEGGPSVSSRLDKPADVARLVATHWALGLAGVVLCRPPRVGVEIDRVLAKGHAAAAGLPAYEVSYHLRDHLSAALGPRGVDIIRTALADNSELAAHVAAAMRPAPTGQPSL